MSEITPESTAFDILSWVLHRIDPQTREEYKDEIREMFGNNDTLGLFCWGLEHLNSDYYLTLIRNIIQREPNADERKAILRYHEWRFSNGDKIAAWEAIKYCQEMGIKPPEWLMEYYAGVADKLLSIEKPKKDARQKIYEAIELDGRSFSRKYLEHPTADDLSLCSKLEYLIVEGRTPAKAYRKLAKDTGRNINTIKRTHLTYRKHPLYQFLISLHQIVG